MTNKNIQKLVLTLALGLMTIISSCKDDIPDIMGLETSRLFSPTDLEARIVNQTGIRLTWKEVPKASSYTLEVLEGSEDGISVRLISDITYDQLPYVVSGLSGGTLHTIRVRAIGGAITESKWISTTIQTEEEQLFRPVDVSDIEAKEVTLRWTGGETATQILLQPGDIRYEVSSTDIANGFAQIQGLSPETDYTATLLNSGKIRGKITFKTLMDLGGAILVLPTDDLLSLVASAESGAVFALSPGTYTISDDLLVNKSISIQALRPAEKPIVKGLVFRVSDGASLTLNNLVFDGTGAKDNNQMLIYSAGTFASLKIENCVISHYIKGAIYMNNASLVEVLDILGNIYHDIECNGGDFIDFRNGIARTFNFKNNTVYRSALARDFFRMDAGGSTNFPTVTSIITIQNNTFYQVTNGNNRRLLYIRLASHQIHFTKNILANTDGYYTNQAATTISTMANNNYFNAPNFTGSSQSGAKNDTGVFTTFNPGFLNAGSDDFTISHEELIFQRIGDPRWIK